jgi:hypothetical protein
MRKRFLQALEGARRSRPGGPFEVKVSLLFLSFLIPYNVFKHSLPEGGN